MKKIIVLFWFLLVLFCLFTYGFTDTNLVLSRSQFFTFFHIPLFILVHSYRSIAMIIYFLFLSLLTWFYIHIFHQDVKAMLFQKMNMWKILFVSSAILLFSFPAFSYDIFNYITTAKVLYAYEENPYLVMPTEIPNEPYLAFTRAANKYALYGPVWLFISLIPHTLGMGNIWQTIIAFKLMNVTAYLLFSYFIYKVTHSYRNVVYFALNPLTLIEILISGHNDIHMMILALVGLWIWNTNKIPERILGATMFILSWFIKGATLALLPLFFIKNITWDKLLFTAYCLLFTVYIILAPIREELYPWYAVWLVSTVSLMSEKHNSLLFEATIVLSFALELRHMPYMWMGYYEGPGPILRIVFTLIPMLIYAAWKLYSLHNYKKYET